MAKKWIFFSLLFCGKACEKNKMPLECELAADEEENAVYEAIFKDPTFYAEPKGVFLDSTTWFGSIQENKEFLLENPMY